MTFTTLPFSSSSLPHDPHSLPRSDLASIEPTPYQKVAGTAVVHGGDLQRAVRRFGKPLDQWIDLSTGINPRAYPVPTVPADMWRRLPEEDDGLCERAAAYFNTSIVPLAVAGSQAAIRALPHCLPPGRVAIADLTYGEYAPAFENAGHSVVRFAYPHADADTVPHTAPAIRPDEAPLIDIDFVIDETGNLPDDIRYLVIVNPNNPTTHFYSAKTLLAWRDTLHAREGMLIVDEAFIDTVPGDSIASLCGIPGLVVLRSIGKFFGLAGVRAGFVLAPADLLAALSHRLGAWSVSGPARHAVRHAIDDDAWQQSNRARLHSDGTRLATILQNQDLSPRSTPLFSWIVHRQAAALQYALAEQAIWTRLFDARHSAGGLPSLRIGLPGSDEEFHRLDRALQRVREAGVPRMPSCD